MTELFVQKISNHGQPVEKQHVPSVSVLMAVYWSDDPYWLGEALTSLVKQTLAPGEVVVVEDGPLPSALDQVLERFRDRLSLRRLSRGTSDGLGAALAWGLERCRNDLVARMDADDVCEPERLEVQAQAFSDAPELSVLGSHATVIDEHSQRIDRRRVPCPEEAIYRRIWACPFIHSAVMLRREAILRIGNYNSRLRTRQDHDLWYRCAEAGLHMRNLEAPLLKYREASQPKNRRLKVVLQHVAINLRGCYRVGVGVSGWVGSFGPLVLYFVPRTLADALRRRLKFS